MMLTAIARHGTIVSEFVITWPEPHCGRSPAVIYLKAMQILTVSDRVVETIYNVGLKERFPAVELALSCGDLPFYYLDFIASTLGVPLYYVLGNHAEEATLSDSAQSNEPGLGGGTNLDGQVTSYRGLLIAGLEGSMWYNGEGHQYTEAQMRAKILRLEPHLWLNRVRYGRALDILITHAPPYHIHDWEDLCHRGFRSFRGLMDRYAPRYLIHGHTHANAPYEPTLTSYKRTTVINSDGYRLLDIEIPLADS
jgi:hypothetical protein